MEIILDIGIYKVSFHFKTKTPKMLLELSIGTQLKRHESILYGKIYVGTFIAFYLFS